MAKRKYLLTALALFFFPLLYPGWMLLGSDGLPGGDLPLYHLPHQQFIRENLVEGVIPFWNPYVFGGSPQFDNPEMTPMYWTNGPLLLLFGAEMMLKLKYLLHLGLLGMGSFLFFRRLSVGTWLAAAGAFTLQISGFAVTKITLPNVGDSAAWLPLILFLTLWMQSRWTPGRALLYTLIGGLMVQLFFPQITLTIILFAALLSAMYYLRCCSDAELVDRKSRAIHRFALPVAEGLVLLSLLRYPPEHIPFPQPGWRNAFGGFGLVGLLSLVAAVVLWILWLVLSRVRCRLEWREILRWTGLFCLLWIIAAGFAAPQLAMTAEMIPQSNQAALDYEDEDFFTGAQAYGSTREFIQQSVMAAPKESVNSMALGPLPWALAILGILAGFHRRHRVFLFLTVFAGLVFTIYMAGPVVFDIFRRLPFFKSFAGLSRYLAFLNFFLVAMAVLSAKGLLRFVRDKSRQILFIVLIVGFIVNSALLLRHQHHYWQRLYNHQATIGYEEWAQWVKDRKLPGGRVLVDARDEALRSRLMILPLAYRIRGVQDSNDPMHSTRYDRWLAEHNDLFGVDYSHYRSACFYPAPSPYLRALGVTDYLFAPGMEIPEAAHKNLEEVGRYDGWLLMRDREHWPLAWPAEDIVSFPTLPNLPAGWSTYYMRTSPNESVYLIRGVESASDVVLSLPWFPGWRAENMPGKSLSVKTAYGFLLAVEGGHPEIVLSYKPRGFIFGWMIFLLVFGAWIVFAVHWWKVRDTMRLYHPWWIPLLPGAVIVLWRGFIIFQQPDNFLLRLSEVVLVFGLALFLAYIWNTRLKNT